MSYVTAVPELMASAATDVAAVGSTLNAAHLAAAASTVAVLPAAADEVSKSIAQLFSGFAQDYQALAGQAAAFQQQFVQHLNAGAGSYTAAEAVNAGSLVSAAASPISTIAALPGQLLNELTGLWNNLTGMFNFLTGTFTLLIDVGYEALVFAYLTLGILIELEMLGLKYVGITIPIP